VHEERCRTSPGWRRTSTAPTQPPYDEPKTSARLMPSAASCAAISSTSAVIVVALE
jgi:hypothetical protein